MKRIASLLVVLLTVTACGGEAPPAAAGPSADDLAAIRKMDAQYVDAVRAGNWASAATIYADKAVLMPPNARLVQGAAAITEWYASTNMTIQEFTTSIEAIGGSGNLAANRGSYRLVFTPAGATEPTTESGKYLWILQRQADKSWKVTSAIWNADAPAK